MKLYSELDHDWINLKGDAQVVVNSVNTPEACPSWYGELIEDAKLLLKQNPLWRVSFIHRKGNQMAHVKAKLGLYTVLTVRAMVL